MHAESTETGISRTRLSIVLFETQSNALLLHMGLFYGGEGEFHAVRGLSM
jgi:hypothetical protein